MINTDLENASKIMIGSQEVEAIYVGSAPIWQNIQLPYDAEIEYLESSGTQWIDTLITPTPNIKCQIKFINKSATGDVIFGCFGDSDYDDYRFFNNSCELYFDIPGNNRIISNIYRINMDIIYELELGNYYVKDLTTNEIIVQSEFVDDFGNIENTITLNHYSTDRNSRNKWYYVKIYNNNKLILDFIPVRKDGVGYMYDKISNQLFGNDGSGDFVLGPDI